MEALETCHCSHDEQIPQDGHDEGKNKTLTSTTLIWRRVVPLTSLQKLTTNKAFVTLWDPNHDAAKGQI